MLISNVKVAFLTVCIINVLNVIHFFLSKMLTMQCWCWKTMGEKSYGIYAWILWFECSCLGWCVNQFSCILYCYVKSRFSMYEL